jgi:hypothetical protein
VREYLDALAGEPIAHGQPKNISLTDPLARWTAAPGGPAFYAYSTNYWIDTAHGVIVDVAATPAQRPAEVESTKTMVDRVEKRFALKPERLIGDMHGLWDGADAGVDDRGQRHRTLKLDRLRLRGLSGASDEFTLAAVAQNLRRLAKLASQGPPVSTLGRMHETKTAHQQLQPGP